jgi:3-methylcrotonyl-CoA carboxylase alpha subunit
MEDRLMRIESGGRVRDVRLERDSARLDGEAIAYRSESSASGGIVEVNGRRHRVVVARRGDRALVWCDGAVFEFAPARSERTGAAHEGDLRAPMPGRIRKTLVSEGQAVTRGDVLLVLEAMKMEHAIRAPRDGTVRRLPHREGDLVETGTALVELADRTAD